MTTSNCTFCKYGGSWTGKGEGHCYMFKEEPQGVCAQHTGNKVQPESEPVATVKAKSDAYGGTFVHWTTLPVAGMRLYISPQVADYVPLSDGQIYTAYIEASNQTLRPQDERIAIAFARAIERAVRGDAQ